MDIGQIIQTLCVYAIPLILAITLHESAHAWAADRLGDSTARSLGRITINPMAHVDPVGTIAVPAVLLIASALTGAGGFVFGWAKPVPINPWRMRNPKMGMGIAAAAGPFSNLAQAVMWALLLKVTYLTGFDERFVHEVCLAGIVSNIYLMAVNLLPLLPFDGGRILRSLMPESAGVMFDKTERWGFLILLVLLAFNLLGYILGPLVRFGEFIVNVVV